MRGARPELRIVDNGSGYEEPISAGDKLSCAENPSGAENSRHCDIKSPAALPSEIAAEWLCIANDLRDRRLWKESMAGLVTSYVLAQSTAQRLELQIATEGASVTGAGGALKPHPATGLLRSSRETVARLGAELGLTPTSRSRKSLRPIGQNELFGGSEFDL